MREQDMVWLLLVTAAAAGVVALVAVAVWLAVRRRDRDEVDESGRPRG